jgi:hypothetical protein
MNGLQVQQVPRNRQLADKSELVIWFEHRMAQKPQ